MATTRRRIRVQRNEEGDDAYPWRWTAHYEEQDDDGEWRTHASEDGDTRGEALDELHLWERRSRGVRHTVEAGRIAAADPARSP